MPAREKMYNSRALRVRYGGLSLSSYERHIRSLLPKPDMLIGATPYWFESSLGVVDEALKQRARELYGEDESEPTN